MGLGMGHLQIEIPVLPYVFVEAQGPVELDPLLDRPGGRETLKLHRACCVSPTRWFSLCLQDGDYEASFEWDRICFFNPRLHNKGSTGSLRLVHSQNPYSSFHRWQLYTGLFSWA